MATFTQITHTKNVQFQEFLHFEIKELDIHRYRSVRRWLEERTSTQIAITKLPSEIFEIDVRIQLNVESTMVKGEFMEWLFKPSTKNEAQPIITICSTKNDLEKIRNHCIEICK